MVVGIIMAAIVLYIFIGCACLAYWDEESGGGLGYEAVAIFAVLWPISLIIYLGFKLGHWLFHRK